MRHLSLDPEQTYHVRELQLARGDIKIYLTEGVLSFAKPLAGRRIAAVFTAENVEAGDAEILILPPQRSERASLASFTNTPNIDEHFTSAVLVFSDETANEILDQIKARDSRTAPEAAAQLAPAANPLLQQVTESIQVRIIQTLLDNHPAPEGFFYATVAGKNLGAFGVFYEPDEFEPVSVGRAATRNGQLTFNLWTSFRPRRAPPYHTPAPRISDYKIDTTISNDLSMSVAAGFDLTASGHDGRVIPLRLSDKLKIENATVDGKPAEVFQRGSAEASELKRGELFLLIVDQPLTPDTTHHIELRYRGSVIWQTPDGSYYVDERNVWFPYNEPTFANFDLTFRYPSRLHLVSTGEPVSEENAGDENIVRRKTLVPEPLAGFNLGEYEESTDTRGPYRVECYANRSSAAEMADIPAQTENILDYYTQRWGKLPIHSVAVTPVPGYFGQGFPGLIYLSNISYMREENRPAELRNPRLDAFFTGLLLPHEVAHQWWGNIVTPANYRASWILEAMANYSALQFVGRTQGPDAVSAVLDSYRHDLLSNMNGKPVDSLGPVDLGPRLLQSSGTRAWHVVTYEKGAWIFHMLHERLGDQGFNEMQSRLLHDYAGKPLSNENLQKIASAAIRPGEPDKSLSLFFDTWIYGTGIPRLALDHGKEGWALTVSDVEDDFIADVPLDCTSAAGKQQVRWVRASSGSNDIEVPASQTCRLPSPSEFLYSP